MHKERKRERENSLSKYKHKGDYPLRDGIHQISKPLSSLTWKSNASSHWAKSEVSSQAPENVLN